MNKSKTRRRTGAATTINPDHVGIHRLIVVGVATSLLAAVLTSWNGLAFVAGWQLLPVGLLWLTPVMVDIPLIVLTLARGALRKRGIRARGLLLGIVALTVFSSGANALHTIATTGFDSIPAVVGTTTNALAPWLILAMTEALWLVVTRPIRPPRPRVKARAKAASKRAPIAVRVIAEPAPEPERDALAALRESAA
jgi:hypothetical protein